MMGSYLKSFFGNLGSKYSKASDAVSLTGVPEGQSSLLTSIDDFVSKQNKDSFEDFDKILLKSVKESLRKGYVSAIETIQADLTGYRYKTFHQDGDNLYSKIDLMLHILKGDVNKSGDYRYWTNRSFKNGRESKGRLESSIEILEDLVDKNVRNIDIYLKNIMNRIFLTVTNYSNYKKLKQAGDSFIDDPHKLYVRTTASKFENVFSRYLYQLKYRDVSKTQTVESDYFKESKKDGKWGRKFRNLALSVLGGVFILNGVNYDVVNSESKIADNKPKVSDVSRAKSSVPKYVMGSLIYDGKTLRHNVSLNLFTGKRYVFAIDTDMNGSVDKFIYGKKAGGKIVYDLRGNLDESIRNNLRFDKTRKFYVGVKSANKPKGEWLVSVSNHSKFNLLNLSETKPERAKVVPNRETVRHLQPSDAVLKKHKKTTDTAGIEKKVRRGRDVTNFDVTKSVDDAIRLISIDEQYRLVSKDNLVFQFDPGVVSAPEDIGITFQSTDLDGKLLDEVRILHPVPQNGKVDKFDVLVPSSLKLDFFPTATVDGSLEYLAAGKIRVIYRDSDKDISQEFDYDQQIKTPFQAVEEAVNKLLMSNPKLSDVPKPSAKLNIAEFSSYIHDFARTWNVDSVNTNFENLESAQANSKSLIAKILDEADGPADGLYFNLPPESYITPLRLAIEKGKESISRKELVEFVQSSRNRLTDLDKVLLFLNAAKNN